MAARADEYITTDAPHTYHADADVFSANLTQPIQREVVKQGLVDLPDQGGYRYKPVEPFQIDGLISFRSGYSQVAGNPSTKHAGFSTLATSVIEGLNVLDVLTADRAVAQIFTEHPDYRKGDGQVPSVSFLGTRFENLRVAGHRVEIEPQLNILGPKPDKDRSYFEDKGVLGRVARQYSKINRVKGGLPDWAKPEYDWDQAAVQSNNKLKCSLFEGVSRAPGLSFGHVIDLPFFGKIFLGELTLDRELGGVSADGTQRPDKYTFHLTMIRVKVGCPVDGSTTAAAAEANGGGKG